MHRLSAAVPLTVVVPGNRHVDLPKSFARQPEMLEVFTELFGPYPFEARGGIAAPTLAKIEISPPFSLKGASNVAIIRLA